MMRTFRWWLWIVLLVTPGAGAQAVSYYRFAVDQDALSGAPDYSFLNHPLTAADRLFVKQGHFYAAGADQLPYTHDDRRVRLFGISFTFGANFPDDVNGDARRVARRLRKLGINLVRLHHMDSTLDAPSNLAAANGILTTDPYPSFNSVSVARLRNFLNALKAEGIYVDLNLHVGYQFRPGVDDVPGLAQGLPEQSKPLHIFYPRMVELQQRYASQLIDKLGLRGDPVLAMVEISNEASMVQAWQWNQLEPVLAGDYKTVHEQQWNAWLKNKYQSTDALRTAWGATQPDGPNLLSGNWQLELHDAARATLTIESPGATAVAHVSGITGGGWTFLKQTGFHMQAGQRYVWKFEARADIAAGATATVNDTIMRDVSPWDGYLYSSVVLTNQWQSYSVAATATFDINDSGRVSLDVENVGGDVYVRNAVLVAAGQQGLNPGETLEAANVQRPGASDGPGSPRLRDYVAFLCDTDRAYMNTMLGSVRAATDALVPVTGTQVGYGGLSIYDSQAALDYQDNHFYIDHPAFPNIAWDPWDWHINDQAAGDTTWSSFADMAWARQAGRPYTVSEFNQPWPNRHGMEIDVALAAFAAFQDWDSIMHFDYLGSRDWDWTAPASFDLNADWTKYPLIGQAAWLFRTGAIETGSDPATVSATAAQRLSSAVAGQSVMQWTKSTLGIPNEFAFTRRVGVEALAASDPTANPVLPSGVQNALTPPYTSSTGELRWDAAQKLMRIDAPAAAGLVGNLGAGLRQTAGAIDVELPSGARGFGAWLVTSLDQAPLARSERMLLSVPGYALRSIPAAGERAPAASTAQPQALVNYQGNASYWTVDPTNASPTWGTWMGKTPPSGNFSYGYAPTYMERVEGWLTLRTSARAVTVSVLDGAGAVVGPLPASEVQAVTGGFRIHINGDTQATQLVLSPWYLITAEQPCLPHTKEPRDRLGRPRCGY